VENFIDFTLGVTNWGHELSKSRFRFNLLPPQVELSYLAYKYDVTGTYLNCVLCKNLNGIGTYFDENMSYVLVFYFVELTMTIP